MNIKKALPLNKESRCSLKRYVYIFCCNGLMIKLNIVFIKIQRKPPTVSWSSFKSLVCHVHRDSKTALTNCVAPWKEAALRDWCSEHFKVDSLSPYILLIRLFSCSKIFPSWRVSDSPPPPPAFGTFVVKYEINTSNVNKVW